jgi:hypothetical protein
MALEQIISPAVLEQAVREAGLVQERSCRLTHCVMLWVVLAMGLFTDAPIRHVFRECRRDHGPERTLLRSIVSTGAQFLVNVPSTPRLDPFRVLSDGSYLARVYATTQDRIHHRGGFVVRVVRYTLDDPQRTGHGEKRRLVTTLLDERQHPARALIALYHERWEHELVYDEQKTHQDPRRATKTTHLRSETPAGVVQELYALSLAHYVVRHALGRPGSIPITCPSRERSGSCACGCPSAST